MAKKNPHKDSEISSADPKSGLHSADPVRYSSDRRALIAEARKRGKTTQQIVVILTKGSSYAEVRILAEQWASELGISQADFVRVAGRRS
jgi:hypothetical protein